MEHILYWLWLTTKRGFFAPKITKLFERFETIEDIYFSKSYNNIYGISEREISRLYDKDLSKAKSVLEKTAKLNVNIITIDDENYPQLLSNIPDPPYVLYIKGNLLELDTLLTIGVVGTRLSSEYGNTVTERICRDLALSGVVTISGMARGIDSAGAWATTDAGGTAVGVIGSGIDIVYPSENIELIKAITENGCIITEYPPGTPPYRSNFPLRNRIIAGLSRGVLVTEAPENSGSLITAKYALENNRDIFAVPRNITEKGFLGTNMLIQQDAKLINNAEDIICEYPYAVKIPPKTSRAPVAAAAPKAVTIDNDKYDKLNEKEKKVIGLLKKSDMQIDEISRELDISVSEVNTRLIKLEVSGLIKRLPGGVYQLKI